MDTETKEVIFGSVVLLVVIAFILIVFGVLALA